jgi:glycosyltransferase involved in cell wall biosynthesis
MSHELSREGIRIVRIFSRLNIGGPSIHVVLLTAGLNDDEFSSTLVIGRESPGEGNMLALAKAHRVEPVVINELGRELNPINDLIAFWRLLLLLRRLRPDIVHTHTSKAGALGRVAARLVGVPIVVHTFHGHTFHSYFHPLQAMIFRLAERWLSRWTTRIIAVSGAVREDLIRYRIADPAKVAVIRLGLELEKFTTCRQYRGQLRHELGLSADIPIVCSVGRLVPVKNHDLLFRSMKRVIAERPDVRLLIVGDGELRLGLEASANRFGLGAHVLFLGWRHDLERIYADADVIVNSSLNEGTPVAVIEAMAAGRPVVATCVGGTPDVVQQGETGWLVESEDVELLAKTILEVLGDGAKTEAVTAAAQRFVLAQFSASTLVERMREFYVSLLAMSQPQRGAPGADS